MHRMLRRRRQRATRAVRGHDGRGPPGIELSGSPLQTLSVDVEPSAGDVVDLVGGGALCDAVGVFALAGEEELALALEVGLVDGAGYEVALAADLPPLEAVDGVNMICSLYNV